MLYGFTYFWTTCMYYYSHWIYSKYPFIGRIHFEVILGVHIFSSFWEALWTTLSQGEMLEAAAVWQVFTHNMIFCDFDVIKAAHKYTDLSLLKFQQSVIITFIVMYPVHMFTLFWFWNKLYTGSCFSDGRNTKNGRNKKKSMKE